MSATFEAVIRWFVVNVTTHRLTSTNTPAWCDPELAAA
jgi:hypothetical protein